jgi:hypothetical protein
MQLDAALNGLGDSLGSAERILDTRMPFALIVHLRTFLSLWLLALPYAMVEDLGWRAAPVTTVLCTFIDLRPAPDGSETRTRALRNTRIKGPLPSTRIPSPPLSQINKNDRRRHSTDLLTELRCISLVSSCRCWRMLCSGWIASQPTSNSRSAPTSQGWLSAISRT